MLSRSARSTVFFLFIMALASPTLAEETLSPSRPAARTERVGEKTLLWVEGSPAAPRQRLLRETEATVYDLRAGADPTGRGQFVTWQEAGQRWGAHSRDAGATWSAPRPVHAGLRLRDATVLPGAAMPRPAPQLLGSADSRLFVAQFRTVGLPEWRAALEGEGARLLGYLPHNAHIVRLDPDRLEAIRQLDFIERVEPYHPSYRIEPTLRGEALDGELVGPARVRVVVFEWGRAAKQRVIETAKGLGADVAEYWPSGHVLELWVDRDQLFALAAHDDVQWIDRWTPPESDMDLVREDAGSNEVHNRFGYCGSGVRGEVMDAGIDADHQDFDGVLLHGDTGVDSHGTATYGIVFGNGDIDGDGDGMAIGHLPCAQGIFASYPETTDRFAHTQELKQSPYFASFQSNSWGNSQTTVYTSASQELDDIVWRLDIAILNSQSNTGNRSSRPQAWSKNVISVGGIRHYETLDPADDAWLGGASIGPAEDGRIKPDVSYWFDSIYTTAPNDGYTPSFGGTSAATPESAGVLGLLVEMWADDVWDTAPQGATAFEKQPHFSTLKALLINTARQYDFVGSGADLGRFKQGWGRPSAKLAQERAARSFVVDQQVELELNDTAVYQIDVPAGESELKVTMVYPDPPGTTSSSMHRINDVDLVVTSPSSTSYLGNAGLEDGPESTAGGTADTLDTVENVFVRNPEAGTWTVTIEAVEVNQDGHLDTPADDVVFALVITGGSAVATSAAGDLRLAPAGLSCDDSITLRVRDANVGQPSLDVEVRSDTETTPEIVTLEQTNPGSGHYTGWISTADSIPATDGLVSVADGDTVVVEYVDADDGAGGVDVVVEATATVDCAAPVISNVWISELGDTEAVVTWTTDEGSSSTVAWGNSVPPAELAERAGRVLTHHVRLRGLEECTTYFYSVSSDDPVGNGTTDDNGGALYLFTTLTRTAGQLHSCRDGTIVLEADTVGCSGNVPIRLTDIDLNLDPDVAETAQVHLSSSTETSPETVVLVEEGTNSGIFTGFVPTGAGDPVGGDGILQTSDRDLVTGRYDDGDDGNGRPVTSVYTIDADCAGAEFVSVSVGPITDAEAAITWQTSEATTGRVEWGTTPALGMQATSDTTAMSHGVTIEGLAECGRIYFRVFATDAHGNPSSSDAGGNPYGFNAWGVPGTYFTDDFESDTGWTLDGEWEIAAPLGLGSAPADPASAFSGTRVLGHDLSGLGTHPGDYEPQSSEAATSPVIDATTFVNTQLKLRRRLNVTNGSFSYIDVRDAGGSWRTVWQTTVVGIADTAWNEMAVDVSSYADNNPDLAIRFRERSFLDTSFASGWNVDDVSLRDGSLPSIAACGECAGEPSFAGLLTATDDDPCADSGVTLEWNAAPGWGSGTGGSYAVYRDLSPGFTPGPATLVAGGLSGTTWNDPTPPADVDLFYVVRAENDETCSTGPANGGVTDTNLAYGPTRNATAQGAPGDVGDSLRIDGVNGAHARLTWQSTAGSAEYRVYRSAFPDAVTELRSSVAGTRYEDRDVFADGQSWYYVVAAADACGNEGP